MAECEFCVDGFCEHTYCEYFLEECPVPYYDDDGICHWASRKDGDGND